MNVSYAQSMEMEKHHVALGIDQFEMVNFQLERLFFGRSTKSVYFKFGWDAGLKMGNLDKGFQYTLGGKWFLKQGKSLTLGVNASFITQEYTSDIDVFKRTRIGGAITGGYTFLIKRRFSIYPYLQTGFYDKEESRTESTTNPDQTSSEFEVIPIFGLDLGFRF